MSSSTRTASSILVLLLCVVHGQKETCSPVAMTLFSSVKSSVDRHQSVCACYPSESFETLYPVSLVACVDACQRLNRSSSTMRCVGVNYQQLDNSCQMYNGQPSAFINRQGCTYYQVMRGHKVYRNLTFSITCSSCLFVGRRVSEAKAKAADHVFVHIIML